MFHMKPHGHGAKMSGMRLAEKIPQWEPEDESPVFKLNISLTNHILLIKQYVI